MLQLNSHYYITALPQSPLADIHGACAVTTYTMGSTVHYRGTILWRKLYSCGVTPKIGGAPCPLVPMPKCTISISYQN